MHLEQNKNRKKKSEQNDDSSWEDDFQDGIKTWKSEFMTD